MGFEHFDHSDCSARNFPPCQMDAAHGHSINDVGIVDTRNNEPRVTFLCKDCTLTLVLTEQLGPIALMMGAPFTRDDVYAKGVSFDEAERLYIDALARNPEDMELREALDRFRTNVAMSRAKLAVENTDSAIVPMAVNEIAALMARTTVSNPRDTKEIN